jgi:hypothetical protein
VSFEPCPGDLQNWSGIVCSRKVVVWLDLFNHRPSLVHVPGRAILAARCVYHRSNGESRPPFSVLCLDAHETDFRAPTQSFVGTIGTRGLRGSAPFSLYDLRHRTATAPVHMLA